MEKLFFHPDMRMDFDWRDIYHFSLGSIRPHNKKQISDGLRDMSPESIRYRFLGSKRDFSEQELQYLTTLDGWNHYAIGVEERTVLKRGVAIIRMVRSSECETEAEIAITIIDEYQKKGLGLFLMNLIMLAAYERKIERLSFTFLPQNEAISKLIARIGPPIQGPHNKDYVQEFLDLQKIDLEKVKSQLLPTLPLIETFHLET